MVAVDDGGGCGKAAAAVVVAGTAGTAVADT